MTTRGPSVVISGIGAVSAVGLDRETSWARLYSGQSGIGVAQGFTPGRKDVNLVGEVRDFDPGIHFDKRTARRLDRCHQLAIVAAREAYRDSGLSAATVDPSRIAVIVGSSLGGTISGQRFERIRIRSGRLVGSHLYQYPLHSLLECITAEFGFRGPRMVFSTACTASTIAISYATELLRCNRADVVLTGGVDPLAELSFAGFASMGNMSALPCAPFSDPIGLTVGEAAAILILERERDARDRGHRPRARILGYGLGADAFHPTSGDPSGHPQAKAARAALDMAGLSSEDLGYVNAHGTGTAGNDLVETRALRMLLGGHAGRVPVSSLKGAFGHTLGAAGAIETAMTALAIERQAIPPTINFTRRRPGCDLDYVPNIGRPHRFQHALSLNFAFGGNNAALLISRADGEPEDVPASCKRRVVVTGLGVVSPIGIGIADFRSALATDRSGVAPIRRLDTKGCGSTLGAAIEDFAPGTVTRADLRRVDRIGSLTICGCDLALHDSGITIDAGNQDRIGIVVGTSHGPVASCRRFFEPVVQRSANRVNPALFPNTVVNAGAGLAAIHLRVKGPNAALSSGQASGLAAICVAYDMISSGVADTMIAGGAEELEQPMLDGYAATGRIAPHERPGRDVEVCAPFDMRRGGLVLGEGATFVVLEALDIAVSRGARIYAEMVGWSGGADRPRTRGWDPTGESMAECMAAALADAGQRPGSVQFVAASAMSHPLHDQIEATAIRQVFGTHRVPVAALVSRVGVSAATAPLAVAAAALGMREGFLPTGVIRSSPDPRCDIDLLEGPASPGRPETALINAAALGGSNYSLVLRRWLA